MTIEEFLGRLEGVKRMGSGYVALCPAHDDNNPSLGVQEGDKGILIQCHSAGCSNEAICAALEIKVADLFYDRKGSVGSLGEIEEVYPYVDEDGKTLFEAIRFAGKKFRQRHLDPETGEYVHNLEGIRRVLFRLPDVLRAAGEGKTIFLCEGEKDVLSIVAQGFEATCNPMGAGKWREEYCEFLAGAVVCIIADKDEVGRQHAERVKESLKLAGITVTVAEAKEGKDASDHLAAGYSLSELVPLIERVRRGIVTAKEMAANAFIHLGALEGSEPEYVCNDFMVGPHPLAFRQGRLTVLGGYTGDGKTSLALQVVRSLCGLPVPPRIGFFSLEMSSDDLRNRLVQHWRVPLYNIEHPWLLAGDEQRYFKAAVGQMETWPLEVTYQTGISAETICEITRDRDYDFVIVDHIHRFNWGEDRRRLEHEIASLTNLALDFNISVAILAQLRAVRSGQGRFETFPKPTLASFKETSVLGEEASLVLAIWRQRNDSSQYDSLGMSELMVLKNRYGPTTTQNLKLDTSSMMFVPPVLGGTTYEHNAAVQASQPVSGSREDY